MRKEYQTIFSSFFNGLFGIAAELSFIGGILAIALLISFVASGMIR